MPEFMLLSAAEQAANYLRERILSGVWADELPGTPMLAAELGVNHRTVIAALHQLEHEGLLVPQGAGRRRRITRPKSISPSALRVALLLYEPCDQSLDYFIDIKNKLEKAGHTVFYAPSNLTEIKMDVRRLARMVEKIEADAWVVTAATHEVLQWFTQQKTPIFALFGRRHQLKIAGGGADNKPAIVEAMRRLIDLGHHRIVFLDSLFSISNPGGTGSTFLGELSTRGINTGAYNLPGWEGGIEGLYAYLDSSFQRTPPTAIIAGSSSNYFATLHFLLSRGIRVPQDLSLVCIGDDPHFKQCRPSVARTQSSNRPVVNRIVRWVSNISQGKEDTRYTRIKAEFIEGGTIGVAPES